MNRNFHVPSLGRAGVSSTLNHLRDQGLSKSTHIWIYPHEVVEYSTYYPDMKIHICIHKKNLAKKKNAIMDYIIANDDAGMIIDDDCGQFILGKTPYNDKHMKFQDYGLVYDLMNRAGQVCHEIGVIFTKRNFITTYNHNETSTFTKFSPPSGLTFLTGKPIISRCDVDNKFEDMNFVTECWLNKEVALKMNLIYCKCVFGSNAGGLQTGKEDFKQSTRERLEEGHKWMVEKYNNAETYTINPDNGHFSSNGTKVRKWLIENGTYTEKQMQKFNELVKELSSRIYHDEQFNQLIKSVGDSKYLEV